MRGTNNSKSTFKNGSKGAFLRAALLLILVGVVIGYNPLPVPSSSGHTSLQPHPHLKKIKDSGINWVRLEANPGNLQETVDLVQQAQGLGLNVIMIVRSLTFLRQHHPDLCPRDFLCYLPGWGKPWEDYVKDVVTRLKPYGVKVWQIDNELNHGIHNPLPSLNLPLRADIVRIGANAVKAVDPSATITVNLFHHSQITDTIGNIALYRALRDVDKVPIDILGMDYYRGSWDEGTPFDYISDLSIHQALWGGDVMIMETGYCTSIAGFDNPIGRAAQVGYVQTLFTALGPFIQSAPWFRGIMFYEYHSMNSGLPCENFFGLHEADGLTEKPAWAEFTKQVQQYNPSGKWLGIMYHGSSVSRPGGAVLLEVWDRYIKDDGSKTEMLSELKPFKLVPGQPAPVENISCPPYPPSGIWRLRGKLYANNPLLPGPGAWKLDEVEGPDPSDPSKRLVRRVQFNDCPSPPAVGSLFPPITMDRNHKLFFNFQNAFADLRISGFRTEPDMRNLQQGQEFQLFVLVSNAGELTALESDRRSPLSGDTRVSVSINGVAGDGSITGAFCDQPPRDCSLQPGELREIHIWRGSNPWFDAPFARSITVNATVDPNDFIYEGINGEQNNTDSITITLAAPTLPDPAFKDPKTDVGFTHVGASTLRLWADVSNLSPVAARDVVVGFGIEGPAGFIVIGKPKIPLLPGGGKQRVEVNWDVCKIAGMAPGRHTVFVQIDPDNSIQELKELNNGTVLEVVVAASANKAKLTTDKSTYQSAEIVMISFFNGCSEAISLSNSAPWLIKDSQGQLVFGPPSFPAITVVQPRQTRRWSWDQKDNNGQQVPPGMYTVELETMDAGMYRASFEIKAAPSCVSAPPGLASWWPGDGNADDIQDGNQGALRNGATFAVGKVGLAFSFDGVDDFVSVPHNQNLNLGNLTIDAWINLGPIPDVSRTRVIVARREINSEDPAISYYFSINEGFSGRPPDGRLAFIVRNPRPIGSSGILSPALTWEPNRWYHVAATLAGRTVTLYRDGVIVGSGQLSPFHDPFPIFITGPLSIGAEQTTSAGAAINHFRGLIDEVEIYNRTLSAAEIQALFAAGSAGKCKPSVEKVKLDVKAVAQTTGGPTLDISVPVLVNGLPPPVTTPTSLQMDKNTSVTLTAQQRVTVTLPFVGPRTLSFKQWECQAQGEPQRVFASTTIGFTLIKDTTCTAVYVEQQ